MALRQKETKMQLKVLWNSRSSRSAKAPCRYTELNKTQEPRRKRKREGEGWTERKKWRKEGRKQGRERTSTVSFLIMTVTKVSLRKFRK